MIKNLIFSILILLLNQAVYAQDNTSDDISSITLNAISVDKTKGYEHLRLLIKAKIAGNFEAVLDTKKAIQKSLEYFFIGLSLHNEVFWVNLNPDESFRIIDSNLGNADMGRIMLAADLRLKEDVSELINPQNSKIGREFWKRLFEKARQLGSIDKIPVETRLWIVPGTAEVIDSQDTVSIVKSELKVCLEPTYYSQGKRGKDKSRAELQEFAAGLIEELVLPVLNERINTAYAYSDLRDVYHSLIIAKWYKQKFSPRNDFLLQIANYEILKDAELNYSYKPEEIYQDYIKSIKEGVYSFTETDSQISPFYTKITTRHYFSGGVDFRNMQMFKTSSPVKNNEDNAYTFFTCELYFPHSIERPLQYAKNNLELTRGNSFWLKPPIISVKNLPAIIPIRFAEERIKNLDDIGKMNRIVLSKL